MKLPLIPILLLALCSCKKQATRDGYGCVVSYVVGDKVMMREENKERVWAYPLTIREVYEDKCKYGYYLATDQNGQRVMFYDSGFKRWKK